jgi:hypothetical protein
VIDPSNGVDGITDLRLEGGRVVGVGVDLAADDAEVLDVAGDWVVPGLIDPHAHLAEGATRDLGHRLLVLAGVTTALDLGGPIGPVLRVAARHGTGLTIGCLDGLGPGARVRSPSPRPGTIRRAFERARSAGAIGVKLHVDIALSPLGIDRVLDEGIRSGSWVAIHCGSTQTRSDLNGLRESIAIAGDRPVHFAHVNSYCRGDVTDPATEAEEALAMLLATPTAFAESYLSPWNGNWGGCRDGAPEVTRVREWLIQGGFPPTEGGLERAILTGFAGVPLVSDDGAAYVTGEGGVAGWRRHGTRTSIGFQVNPFISRVRLATARGPQGFTVAALATDGGVLPRNVMVSAGLELVSLGGWTPADFVEKTSTAAARALGLTGKGHLGVGADADVTVIDPSRRAANLTIAGGHVVARHGTVLGRGTTVLTTEEGERRVSAAGCTTRRFDPATSGLLRGVLRQGVA